MKIQTWTSNLKFLRKKSKQTQNQLALQLNVTQQTVGNWEKGENKPDLYQIIDITRIFGISAEDFLKNDMSLESNSEHFEGSAGHFPKKNKEKPVPQYEKLLNEKLPLESRLAVLDEVIYEYGFKNQPTKNFFYYFMRKYILGYITLDDMVLNFNLDSETAIDFLRDMAKGVEGVTTEILLKGLVYFNADPGMFFSDISPIKKYNDKLPPTEIEKILHEQELRNEKRFREMQEQIAGQTKRISA